MILFDNTMLSALFLRNDQSDLKAKADSVVEVAQSRIIIPTPALCECLAKAGPAGEEILNVIRSTSNFKIADFGQRAAFECAELIAAAKSKADKRHEGQTWAKAKFDWQIMAIAIVESVTVIYSDDDDLAAPAARAKIRIVKLADVKVSPKLAQRSLSLKTKK